MPLDLTTIRNQFPALRRRPARKSKPAWPCAPPEMGQRPGRIYIMNQRTKWGACSTRGNLTFNNCRLTWPHPKCWTISWYTNWRIW